jgi:hypothetical protein
MRLRREFVETLLQERLAHLKAVEQRTPRLAQLKLVAEDCARLANEKAEAREIQTHLTHFKAAAEECSTVAKEKLDAQEIRTRQAQFRSAAQQCARVAKEIRTRRVQWKMTAEHCATVAKEKIDAEESRARLVHLKTAAEACARVAKEKADDSEMRTFLALLKIAAEQCATAAQEKAKDRNARLALWKAAAEQCALLAQEKTHQKENARIAKENAEKEENARIAKEKAEEEERLRVKADQKKKMEAQAAEKLGQAQKIALIQLDKVLEATLPMRKKFLVSTPLRSHTPTAETHSNNAIQADKKTTRRTEIAKPPPCHKEQEYMLDMAEKSQHRTLALFEQLEVSSTCHKILVQQLMPLQQKIKEEPTKRSECLARSQQMLQSVFKPYDTDDVAVPLSERIDSTATSLRLAGAYINWRKELYVHKQALKGRQLPSGWIVPDIFSKVSGFEDCSFCGWYDAYGSNYQLPEEEGAGAVACNRCMMGLCRVSGT